MKVALFIGNHVEDDLLTRCGWYVTRKMQKGPLAMVTHVEAIQAEYENGSVMIASASVRDGGVRSKRVFLNPAHWQIVDVPQWDVAKSIALLQHTKGMRYDYRGAIATAFLGSQDPDRWFCNEWVGAPFIVASGTFGPHHFAAICLSLGADITTEFFRTRQSFTMTSVALVV